jgi:hypothetical protein
MIALNRCGPAPARQQRSMQIEAAERHGIEDVFRQDHAVGHNNRGVRIMGTKLCFGFRRLEGLRRQYRNAELPRGDFHRRRLQLHAPSGGFRLACIDRHDLVAVIRQRQQRRHRKIGRAHEDQTKRHQGPRLISPRAWRPW